MEVFLTQVQGTADWGERVRGGGARPVMCDGMVSSRRRLKSLSRPWTIAVNHGTAGGPLKCIDHSSAEHVAIMPFISSLRSAFPVSPPLVYISSFISHLALLHISSFTSGPSVMATCHLLLCSLR